MLCGACDKVRLLVKGILNIGYSEAFERVCIEYKSMRNPKLLFVINIIRGKNAKKQEVRYSKDTSVLVYFLEI